VRKEGPGAAGCVGRSKYRSWQDVGRNTKEKAGYKTVDTLAGKSSYNLPQTACRAWDASRTKVYERLDRGINNLHTTRSLI
jgi:hypothetical protein